jgi:hypothetical protein
VRLASNRNRHRPIIADPTSTSWPAICRKRCGTVYESAAIDLAESLIAPGASLDAPEHIQISLNIPPWDHRPCGPHIDGLTV